MTLNRIYVAVLTVVFAIQVPVTARAGDRIMMYANNIGPDHAFIQSRIEGDGGEDCLWCGVDPKSTYVGRFDLNDDGVEELFVCYNHDSGICDAEIFRKSDHQWEEISRMMITVENLTESFYLIASDERVDGWRTLLSSDSGFRWSPSESQYNDFFCLSEVCLEIEGPQAAQAPSQGTDRPQAQAQGMGKSPPGVTAASVWPASPITLQFREALRKLESQQGSQAWNLPTVRAEGRIMMYADNIGPDRAFLERVVEEILEDCSNACLREITLDDLYIGRFDLNDDGVEELFVYRSISYYCGTSGCRTDILWKSGGRWEKVGQMRTVFGDLMGPFYLIADDERIDGWRTLLTYEYGFRWSPAESQYNDFFCLTEVCFERYRYYGLEDEVRRD